MDSSPERPAPVCAFAASLMTLITEFLSLLNVWRISFLQGRNLNWVVRLHPFPGQSISLPFPAA